MARADRAGSVNMLYKLLRRRGAVLPAAAVEGTPWTIARLEWRAGCLVLQSLNSAPDRHLHALYTAVVARVDGDSLVLRGVERIEEPDGVAGVVQEWQLKVPPELAGLGMNLPAARGINGWGSASRG